MPTHVDWHTPEERYEDRGLIGLGGMGEVRKVLDRQLNRTVAMKIIRAEFKDHPRALARFFEEAQVSAQLAHPSIVPVHDLGRLHDGRYYFTMQEIHGSTLTSVLRTLHASSRYAWQATSDGWTFRRVLDAFRRVCDAIAYSHSRGVLHRDLKPDNIMLGSYGEVLVMDWGLAKVRAQDLTPDPVSSSRIVNDGTQTRIGTVAGTPAYMSPEQARGQLDNLGPRSDVYSLGSVFYEILSGKPPFSGPKALQSVLAGPPPALKDTPYRKGKQRGPPIPKALRNICAKAMNRAPRHRYSDASQLAQDLLEWLDGARKREQALVLVNKADALEPQVRSLRSRAAHLRTESATMLTELPPGASIQDKRGPWSLEDEAEALELEAELKNVHVMQHLRAALTEAPDTAEAHNKLAAHYQSRHASAQGRRDARAQAALEALLRTHNTGVYNDYLRGEGTLDVRLTVVAQVDLLRFVEQDRRLVPTHVRSFGPTDHVRAELSHGSYLLHIRAPGQQTIRYPVYIDRQKATRDAQSQRSDALRVQVQTPDSDIYIPAGWSWTGGDNQAVGSLARQRLWVDDFVISKAPITHREFVNFLNRLAHKDGIDIALHHAPRLEGMREVGAHGLIYDLKDGVFSLGPTHAADAPVTHVSWSAAVAFSASRARITGEAWRLPTEMEWERAARGADGRFFPWGDYLDSTFCRLRAIHRTARSPDSVLAWPMDESPFGVTGMAGNTRDWCADAYRTDGPKVKQHIAIAYADPHAAARCVRGGSWTLRAQQARSACRGWEPPNTRASDLGFRLARSLLSSN
ncbi:MAG: serine/threonine protein kinase/formylglycine-generating enzyme required for sulfatase activity [Kiritimatiellia bacterium]